MLDWVGHISETMRQSTEALQLYVAAEHPGFQSAVLTAYGALNSIRLLAYIPQILAVARDEDGARAVSNTTWLLFLIANLSTICYALVFVGDVLMAVIFLGNAAGCFLIIAITFSKRRSAARSRQPLTG